MYIESLAVRYRPHTFDEVTSQTSVIKILKRQLELNSFKNAYLFCGPSGCGKTTIARIFAREINKGIGEPIEIDAASNNGVDNVRKIIDDSVNRSLDSEYKIFLIDECHSLTNQSWQAFLKGIEEPPKYTIFIFCTTDPQKIPDTITNRCMRFNFTRISSEHIKDRLNYICKEECFTNYHESTEYISKICKGQMRDAISYLEKAASYDNNINIENTLNALGNYSYDTFFKLMNSIIDVKEESILKIVEEFYLNGGDIKQFVEQFLTFTLDILKYCLFKNCDLIKIPSTMEPELKNVTAIQNAGKYYTYITDKMLELKNEIKGDINPISTIELKLLKMARCK